MHWRRTIFVPAIFLFLLSLSLPVQADNIQADFQNAYRLLNVGDYTGAYSLFSQLYLQHPTDADADQFLFFKAKAGYYAGLYESSIIDFKNLIKQFPQSKYKAYAYFFLGNSYYRVSRADMAIRAYLDAYKNSTDKELDRIILSTIESFPLDPRTAILEQISSANLPDSRKCDILIAAAKALIKQKNYRPVNNLLLPCGQTEARSLVEQANQFLKQETELGAVLPLSGDLQKFGEQILDGILLRVEQYKQKTGGVLKPVLYDTKGDNLEAARIIKRLAQSGAAAAIGPLTSSATSVASAVLACGDMPLIIPAATEGGLTELSSTSFQLQPNLDLQGIRMADYAIQWLGADTAAIITPTATSNLRMAKAFAKRFKDLGGTILGIEYFRANETDFGPYIRDLKSLIMGELLDSVVFIDDVGDTIEAEEVPVQLDCLFIPADADQLRQLLPQIQFYNLNTVYLGNDGWGNSQVYNLGQLITRECYFASGILGSDQSQAFQQFAVDFDKKYGRPPGHLEALGYDAASLICDALAAGLYTRSEIAEHIAATTDYQGAAGKVSFGEQHENIELPIYTIKDGLPKQVSLGNKQE